VTRVVVTEDKKYVVVDKQTTNVRVDVIEPSVKVQAPGVVGPPGSQILSSNGAPDSALGVIGDFYLNKTTNELYGPKTQETGWGTPINLGSAEFENQFDLDSPEDGQVIEYDADQDLWVPKHIRYTHVQSAATSTWTVNHNLGIRPGGVTVVDSGENVVFGDVLYANDNSLTITFSSAFGGKVYLS
jgi:hypothetical protein